MRTDDLSANQISQEKFGTMPNGTPVPIYTLRNANGVEARICTYGGVVGSLKGPDRHGQLADVVLGFDDLESYVKDNPTFGALVGRFANRIAKGKFSLNGKTYT